MEAIAKHYQPAIAFATDLPRTFRNFSRFFALSPALAMTAGIAEEGPAHRDILSGWSETLSWTWD
jgi:hypothetical protein